MAVPMIYLKLEVKGKPVLGDSQLADYEDQIAIESMSWEVSAAHKEKSPSQKARTEARPKVVRLSKFFDKSTTSLCMHMNKREPFKVATLTVLSMVLGGSDGKNLKLMTLQLTDGYVESVDVSAADAGKAMAVKENVTLSFRRCKLMYYPADLTRVGREAPTTFELDAASIAA
jgi:type VI secretion system Hcp family effector